MASERARLAAVRLLEGIDPTAQHEFAFETRAELERRGFVVRDAPPSSDGAGCSVAGSYQAGPPPVITVASDRSPGRRHFTALHEFGHSLVQSDGATQDLLFGEPDRGVRLEEEICDAIAAELLLPSALVADYIDDRGPTARSVLNLFHGSEASREACCVRAAQLLVGEGHVMLARDGVAIFTASAGTPFRVRRETEQGAGHITATAARHGGARGIDSVVYGSGGVSDRYQCDALADDDGHVFAVFVADRPAWESGLNLIGGDDRSDPVEVECPRCEVQFTTLAAPCSRCGDYTHTGGCGRCSCVAGTERLCPGCFIRQPAHLFASPDAEQCTECADG